MDAQKERNSLIHILYILMMLGLIYLFFHTILYEILPFLFGFMIAFSLRPAIRHTIALCHLPQKLVSIWYLLLFYGTIGVAITLLVMQCIHFLTSFVPTFPAIYEYQIAPLIDQLFTAIQLELTHIPADTMVALTQFFDSASASLESFAISSSSRIFSILTSMVSSLPSIIVSFFITILSSIFFTMDFPKVSSFIMRQIPRQKHQQLYRVREIITDAIQHYFGAYGKLMLITFIELSIGLSYLQVDKAIVIALIISCFDILPILGTGTILFPWILISFFNHRMKFAIGLLILHLIINLLRQIIEPKIVGKQLGIHPLLMLGCMFFGVKLFGFLGIFIAPILLQILCRLNEEGLIHLYR